MRIEFSKKRAALTVPPIFFLLTFIYYNRALFLVDGVYSRNLACTALGLVLLAGCLLIPKITLHPTADKVLSILSFFATPLLCFWMVETLNGRLLEYYKDLVFWVNYFLYLLVICILYFFTNRVRVAVIASLLFSFLVGLIFMLVYMFRGTPLLPADLFAVRTAMNVMGNYKMTVTGSVLLVVAVLVAAIALAGNFRIKCTKKWKRWTQKGILALFTLTAFSCIYKTDVMANAGLKVIDFWAQENTYREQGIALGFILNSQYLVVENPVGYSPKVVKDLLQSTEEVQSSRVTGTQYPNIIAIMNESFSDLSVRGTLEVDTPYMPFTASLRENAVYGHLYMSTFGGGTSNSEWEFLTGGSMSYLPVGSIAYQQYIHGETDSIVKTVDTLGYRKSAMHPHGSTGWNRYRVYPWLGFEETRFWDTYTFPEDIVRVFPSDRCTYTEIIRQYEEKDGDTPLFIFDVTMQNHGGYTVEDYEPTVRIQNMQGSYPDAEQYLSLIRESDLAFQELVTYFSQQEEPTIILMFGDHQPSLSTDFYRELDGKESSEKTIEERQLEYVTPFIIWANYDIESREVDKISANYLSTLLLETAGLPLPPYNQYLKQVYTQYPVINALGVIDSQGNYYQRGEEPDDELLHGYEMLQYNSVFDSKNRIPGLYSVKSQ
ncbi:Phosphoglycerol transferase and related proteins%2C alkaline phosphatase superfamily [Anaerotruncus sp. 2789STDY5834896]|uniref:Phosphoglycerol transferase and related proteins, alkaline phosphatase superfamily n=1 Tax=uncultured Anaerotruncus sp. TaxID=905011 RepID=A0A1C6H0Z1_9FIRM|nr:Phosphoglycerol transferase and related proteins%2C alkaline phosphatase superfamily [uncultured Anaerotruncus sp.]